MAGEAGTAAEKARERGARKYAYNLEGAREREMHLYLPYWGFTESEKYAQQPVGSWPNASRDNVLTVFAQLAALRLNAKRALISLFDRKSQHVVAESTQRLGLRGSDGSEQSASLWIGVRRLPRRRILMCDDAMRSYIDDGQEMYLVEDLSQNARYRDHPSVAGPPHHRFYVSAPIQSPDNYIIGNVAVLDDQPRKKLSDEETRFLKDLAITVMDHLLTQRAMREEYREEKMVRALGLFVRDKSDLTDNFHSHKSPPQDENEALTNVNRRLERLQVSGQDEEQQDTSDQETEDTTTSNGAQEQTGKTKRSSPVQKFKNESEDGQEENHEDATPAGKRPRLSPTTSQLRDSIAPSNVRSVLDRASNLMNQALDVEGAMFIDASVYARRQVIESTETKKESTGIESRDHASAGGRGAENDASSLASLRSDREPKSLVLGYSTSSNSSKNENFDDSNYVALAGDFVSHLIDQYPRGTIFHIEEDGSLALSYEGVADDIDGTTSIESKVRTSDARNKDIERETADLKPLTKLLPDARCIAIYPIWDFQRGRWFTVCVVWANDPGRVLSEPKDLTYMAAFSNTVMAEVSRLDLETANRAKGDFISSISHELRSPLHGLLGTVELLQEIGTSYAQRSLIGTVYSCGRTLLDTLNHLLDYAKINTLTGSRMPPESHPSDGDQPSNEPRLAVSGSLQDEDLSILVQEVVEGLLAGAEFVSRGSDAGRPPSDDDVSDNSVVLQKSDDIASRVITIVDIEWQDTWDVSIYSGAWRRVIMNLFGNALKYTTTGYIRLLMKRDTLKLDGDKPTPAVRLTISDSGRGMSQDFLTHHLYTPFLQEDTTSPGLGVGLHLVQQIVKSLDGHIKFTSEVSRGTHVDVVLPISKSEESTASSPPVYHRLKEKLQGMTISLFTKSSQRGNLGIDPRLFEDMLSSLRRMVTDWFGLRVLTTEELKQQRADITMVTEHEYSDREQGSSDDADGDDREDVPDPLPLIVLGAKGSRLKNLQASDGNAAIFLSQPVSPKTLATAFEHCLDQRGKLKSTRSERNGHHNTPSRAENANCQSNGWTDSSPKQRRDSSEQPVSPRSQSSATDSANVNAKDLPADIGLKPETAKGSKSILLVEDNQVNLKIIEMCVKTAGFTYQTATNGLDALEKFKANDFDAVVMDISMPVMDGLTATRNIRHYEKSNQLPPTSIIILTAVLSSQMQHEAMMSGVNMFLTKPTPLKQLKEILQNLPDPTATA